MIHPERDLHHTGHTGPERPHFLPARQTGIRGQKAGAEDNKPGSKTPFKGNPWVRTDERVVSHKKTSIFWRIIVRPPFQVPVDAG